MCCTRWACSGRVTSCAGTGCRGSERSRTGSARRGGPVTVPYEQRLAAKVLEAVEEHPETLNMHDWASVGLEPNEHPAQCGTTLCLAGWTAHLLGYAIQDDEGWARHPLSGEQGHVFTIARMALGLDVDQAVVIFNSSPKPRALALLRRLADGGGFPELPIPKELTLDH